VAALLRRRSIELPPEIAWRPVIHGVETPGDRIFFEHYVYRLSNVLTAENHQNSNAFKDMLLPLATEHLGLMHSILSLSSRNINYEGPYGRALLEKHPGVTQEQLDARSSFHHDRALSEFNADASREREGLIDTNTILPVRLGQMLCMVLKSIAEGNTYGDHRAHLIGYQGLIQEFPPKESEFMEFIKEFFEYHISADEIVSLPQGPERLGALGEDFDLPAGVSPGPEAVRLLGVQDGCFLYMSKITNIRNKIRYRMQQHTTPVVDAESLYRGTEIDAGIREWSPSWPDGGTRDIAGLLYKQMLYVYLWRTLYPPSPTTFKLDPRIKENVDYGLLLLERVPETDCTQTLLLAPTFVIGCAAFEDSQRKRVERAIGVIGEYTNLRNAVPAMEVLREVWRLMDAREEESWDWQTVAHNMGKDFLAT
jgi:hypothetical protein